MSRVTRHEPMLNPPLSLLPDDLFPYIVDHVAELPFSIDHLRNLSIADRAFTQSCQAHIFKVLYLSYRTTNKICNNLEKLRMILDDNPSFANRVRVVDLAIPHKRNGWLFNYPTFNNIIQLLAKSLRPPHKLVLSGINIHPFTFEDPVLIVGWLMQSFFSRTLTVLHLTDCKNVPLTLFLICPGLREIFLDHVEASKESYGEYPDEQCSGRELATPEHLNYRNSESLIKQMITPPPRFHVAVVSWSRLRVLTLCPHEKEEMACLQPILDAACNTLEELHLTNLKVTGDDSMRSHFYQSEANLISFKLLPLAGLVNLGDLSCLHVFAFYSIIKCGAPDFAVVRDINRVLSTIPTSNQVTSLSFDFSIRGGYSFNGCLEEDWVEICDEIVRISGGKHLKLTLKLHVIHTKRFRIPGGDQLYRRIMERLVSLSEYPNIDFRHLAIWE